MTLAPVLFNRRYRDLVEIGRSRLPGLAPEWTDHNAHDPGITLIELLAWVTEAQLYSLSRMRRDERAAYAALMGFVPSGMQPARGLLWPDRDDPDAQAQMPQQAEFIAADTAIHVSGGDVPTFLPARPMLWVPARIVSVRSRFPDGMSADHLSANVRGGPAFAPFGDGDGRGVVFELGLTAAGWAPLFKADRPRDGTLAIGIRVERDNAEAAASSGTGAPFEVTLTTEEGTFPLAVIEDGTHGMLRTGVMVLKLSEVEGAPKVATIEFRAPMGVDRAPRVLRIEPNVLAIVQHRMVEEQHDADGTPDQQFDLETPGITFAPGASPVVIEVERHGAMAPWTQCERLSDAGPEDRVFAFDPTAARVMFGNGINGAIPPAERTIIARYIASDGRLGNVAANRRWVVRGFAGNFGINIDAIADGADAAGLIDQRSAARIAIREGHALVSARDFETAALGLPDLEVGRAWMRPPTRGSLAGEPMQLIVMRTRQQGREPEQVPETGRWLAAVQRALNARLLLGTRIVVAAPRYVDFAIACTVEPEPRIEPSKVEKRVLDELARRLILVSASPAIPARPFGLNVTARDVSAWIEALPEVRRVQELRFLPAEGVTADRVTLTATGLPRLNVEGSDIKAVRPGEGGSR